MRTAIKVAIIAVCLACAGSQEVTASEPSSTFTRLETEFPLDSKSVVVKKCSVDGEDFAKPSQPIKTSQGKMIELDGLLAPGKMGLRGIIPKWTRRDGEPHEILTHASQANEQPYFMVLLVYGSEVSKNKGAVFHDLVDNRQTAFVGIGDFPLDKLNAVPDLTEFRCRFAAPLRAGQYVIDLRLVGDRNNGAAPIVLPFWRCELEVE